MKADRDAERERAFWERNERERTRTLREDARRPPSELLAEILDLSEFAVALASSVRESDESRE